MAYRPSSFEKKVAKLQFGYEARRQFYTQLMSLLRTGMTTAQAIRMSWDVASLEGKKPKEGVAIILQDVMERMADGKMLGQALKPWAPQEDVMVLDAIENSSDFVGNLKSYLDMLAKKRKIKSAITGGLTYPAILIAAVIAIMAYFGSSIVPKKNCIGVKGCSRLIRSAITVALRKK